jgi:hypothetical protein
MRRAKTGVQSQGQPKRLIGEVTKMARKFLGIIYRTLKYQWTFADFPNFVLAEETTGEERGGCG